MPNRPFCFRVTLFLYGSLLFIPSARTQSAMNQSKDEVHIIPQAGPAEATPYKAKLSDHEPTLPRAKPLRADVDVVLVPVTVTDPMNRPVLGLKKQDFSVY